MFSSGCQPMDCVSLEVESKTGRLIAFSIISIHYLQVATKAQFLAQHRLQNWLVIMLMKQKVMWFHIEFC